MKNFYTLKVAIPIVLSALGFCTMAQQNPHMGLGNNPNVIQPFGVPRSNMLIVSKQTNQATRLQGQFRKQTDEFENGKVTLSTEGPITVNVNPSQPSQSEPGAIELSIGTNQNINWQGTLTVNMADAPPPGFSTPAKITGTYHIEYAKTLQPGEFADSTWTSLDENGNTRYHGLIRQSGMDEMNLSVVSMKVDLPQMICLGAAGVRIVNAAQSVFPPNFPGATFRWRSLHNKVTIANGNTAAPTITLLDTSIKNAQVELTYTIDNISYTGTAFVSNCECQCLPISTNILVGPVEVAVQVNPVAPVPDANGNCNYLSDNARITLQMNELQGISRMAEIAGVTIGIVRNCETRAVVAGTFRWQGNIEMPALEFQIPTGEKIKTFDLALKEINLAVDANARLSGSVKVLVTNPVDRDLTWNKGIVMLRQGTNSLVTFNFSNQMNFTGSWDWSGIQNIAIDLVKKDGNQDKIIAAFRGNFDADGLLSGDLTVRPNASYRTNQFKITMDQLTLGLAANIKQGTFRLTHGNGKATVSDVRGIQGRFVLMLNFPLAGGCTATVQAQGVKAFTMELDELNVNADFNRDFDLQRIHGSLKAKHPKFSAKVNVQNFVVRSGTLEEFRCNGNVKYSKFNFVIANAHYADEILNITARVELKATGVAAMAQINEFTINENGVIGIGGIEGNLNKGVASLHVRMTFQDNGFQGTFDGQVASIGLNGTLNYGSKEDPDFHYVYFSINLRHEEGLPIGNTGLKLTQAGGKVGYNYSFIGTGVNGEPRQGIYLIGISAGIADAANMCEILGEIRFELSVENVNITLDGRVNVLKNTPYFSGNVSATYSIPANTISGSLGASIRFPMNGSILRSDTARIGFHFGNRQFRANGNNMRGDMFGGLITLRQGFINMEGNLDNVQNFTGRVGGRLTSQFGYQDSWFNGTVTFNAQIVMNSEFTANINSQGLTGTFEISVSGSATATVDLYFYSASYGVQLEVSGSASYNNNKFRITGGARLIIPSVYTYNNPNITITL